jgi:hypothetical protein
MQMDTKYTVQQLEHHLSYEIRMLNGAYELILKIDDMLTRGGASEQQRKDALNAMKEDFCLHARALLEFFTRTRTNSATGFATSAYVAGTAPHDMERKLNNQISHLMVNRTDIDADKIWGTDRDTLFRWIEAELQRWISMWDASYSAMIIPSVDLSLIPSAPAST